MSARFARRQFQSSRRQVVVVVFAIEARRDVAGLLAAHQLALVFLEDAILDFRAAACVDRMRNVGVQLHALVAVSVAELLVAVFVEAFPAVVAVAGAKVIFFATMRAVVGQLARGHRQENALIAVDQFYIAHDECVIKSQRAEGLEAAAALTA